MHLSLIGLPGVGKTTIGKLLANYLQLNFFDLDEVIENYLNYSIKEYFNNHGEVVFRRLENKQLKELFLKEKKPVVLSTGGGIILTENNRILLKEYSKIFYLKAELKFIEKNLKNQNNRPLFQNANILEKLDQLNKERQYLYEEIADFTIIINDGNINNITQNIINLLEK